MRAPPKELQISTTLRERKKSETYDNPEEQTNKGQTKKPKSRRLQKR